MKNFLSLLPVLLSVTAYSQSPEPFFNEFHINISDRLFSVGTPGMGFGVARATNPFRQGQFITGLELMRYGDFRQYVRMGHFNWLENCTTIHTIISVPFTGRLNIGKPGEKRSYSPFFLQISLHVNLWNIETDKAIGHLFHITPDPKQSYYTHEPYKRTSTNEPGIGAALGMGLRFRAIKKIQPLFRLDIVTPCLADKYDGYNYSRGFFCKMAFGIELHK